MDHSEAVRIQAVEKYILGELTPRLRSDFEEHYFDCVDCAVNLRAGVAFAAASRLYFAEVAVPERPVALPAASRWFGWWKPLVMVPTFAALLFIVAYQNLVSIPNLQHASKSAVAVAPPMFSLVNSTVHGSAGTPVQVAQGQPFDLVLDVTAEPRDPNSIFLLTAKDASGNALTSLSVSAVRARQPVILHVPGVASEGSYKVVIMDQAAGSSTPAGEQPFTVAFSSQIQQH